MTRSSLTVMNVTVLFNETASTVGQSIPAIISSRVMEVKEMDMSPIPTQVSDKPCNDAISVQTPTSVKLPGSLDALLYIVIVLVFYAFSIVILMVKYIRREREEASLRSYYHEFVSREKFRSAQYKNRQFMKRIFSRHGDFDQQAMSSLEDETVCSESSRKIGYQPEGNNFSRLLLNLEEDDKKGKESFTFLGAKSQFCKNTLFGKRFCNKQLCSKCVSENVPTIDWDEDHDDKIGSSYDNSESVQKIIEVTMHRSVMEKSPQLAKITPCYTEDVYGYSARCNDSDSLFHPIVESEGEQKESEFNVHTRADSPSWGLAHTRADSPSWGVAPRRKPEVNQRDNSLEEHAIVSSCSLEVSELLANMPPLGISNSPSNDMDTLDGLSNLDSETENQSLLNYSSSIRLQRDQSLTRNSKGSKKSCDGKGDNVRFLNTTGADKSDRLSDRSSLLSCSFSFDDGEKSAYSSHFTPQEVLYPSAYPSVDPRKPENGRTNGKIRHINNIIPTPRDDKGEDDEMARLLNDITVLADQSGVFRNLKYFLRGFYKSDIEDPSENSNLLPKETYFGPGSPKSLKRRDNLFKPGTNGDSIHNNFNQRDSLYDEEDMFSNEIMKSLGNRWAYTYDEEDGIISDTDRSSSFGDYCMGETAGSQIIDLSKPLARRDIDSNVKDGLSRALIGLNDAYSNNYIEREKDNPMIAGYGPARKETKV